MSSLLVIGGALLAGLLGTLHCAAMCGGIAGAMAAGQAHVAAPHRRVLLLLTSLGRICSYAAAGAIAAGCGLVVVHGSGSGTLRTTAQVAAGGALVLIGLRAAGLTAATRWLDRAGAGFWRHLAPLLGGVLPLTTPWRAFAAGALWGWLPCGMVYAALLLAATSLDPLQGSLAMLAFGVGTLPGVLLAQGTLAAMLRGGGRWRPAMAWTMVLGGALSVATALPFGAIDAGHHGGHAHASGR